VEKAKEFYVDYLGFRVDWEHHYEENTPAYMTIAAVGDVYHFLANGEDTGGKYGARGQRAVAW
jgi:catechol 2,3-dioxygenase-like lactoylglutathione lyase family enzyme